MKRMAGMPLWALLVFFCSGGAAYALNANQCVYFNAEGKTPICHATGSTKNPFLLIHISAEACINAHTSHAADFVALGDTCEGRSCLPSGAPCDATLGCCEGACVEGTCQGRSCQPTGAQCNATPDCCEGACVDNICEAAGHDATASESSEMVCTQSRR